VSRYNIVVPNGFMNRRKVEELAYWQRRTEEFRQLQQQRQQANPKGVSTAQ